jgi:hypothetical protein
MWLRVRGTLAALERRTDAMVTDDPDGGKFTIPGRSRRAAIGLFVCCLPAIAVWLRRLRRAGGSPASILGIRGDGWTKKSADNPERPSALLNTSSDINWRASEDAMPIASR